MVKTNQREATALEATAFHEAGHAFADWKFGYRIKEASIIATADSHGHVIARTGLHLSSLA